MDPDRSTEGRGGAETVASFLHELRASMGAEHVAALESCLGCGCCGTACAWYLETGDARLHPTRRIEFLRRVHRRELTPEGRLWRRLLGDRLGVADLREIREAFWKCSACGRCTLACPLGISQRSLFRWARNAYAACGLGGENATRRAIADHTRAGSHSFGVPRERLFTLLATAFGASGIEAPIDVHGAEHLLAFPTVDALRFPDQLAELYGLLNAMGLSYTSSSRLVDLGTEIDHVVADHALARRMLREVEDEARRLGVGRLIVPECGCDVRTFHVDAAALLGRRLEVEVRSVDLLLRDALAAGRLPVVPLRARLAVHDPCQVTRLAGLGQVARDILAIVAPRFVEMDPSREHNYCCNGSSGPMRLPENTDLRRRVSRLKAEQIRRAGADAVVTPCAICTLSLRDICDHYGLGQGAKAVRILYDVVFEAVRAGLRESGRDALVRSPAVLRGRTEEYVVRHSLSGLHSRLRELPGYAEHRRWVNEQEWARRPGARETDAREGLRPAPAPEAR